MRGRLWRESATLIVLARNNNNAKIIGENYKVLVFKRPEKTHFMPSSVVFPGGAVELKDQSRDWIAHFKNFGISETHLNDLTRVGGKRPPMFLENDNSIRKEISLRITAIRETFEELGILICRKKDELEASSNDCFGKCFEDFNKKKWQKAVHKDPSKFLELCQELEVVPDLWNLYEWSAWLTPTIFMNRSNKLFSSRFETAFFLVALTNMPNVLPEENEVQEAYWKTPSELIKEHFSEQAWLPPPQFYELSRIKKFNEIEKLADFAKGRNLKGISLLFPIQYNCSDGVFHVLPGDDLYPENPNFNESSHDSDKFIAETLENVRLKATKIHRSEHRSAYDVKYFLNFAPCYGHVSPLPDDGEKSKL